MKNTLWLLAFTSALSFMTASQAQEVQGAAAQPVQDLTAGGAADCAQHPSGEAANTAKPSEPEAACARTSLSDYNKTLAASPNHGKTVEADLVDSDWPKPAIFPIDVWHSRLAPLYDFKKRVNDALGLTWSVDYTVLFQKSNYTESGEDTASSSVFRILGTWLQVGDLDMTSGHLVWKVETRNPIFGNPAPRDMGFDTGSVLSTANFKVLDYWGITDLYWQQRFRGGYTAFHVGHMDPGDWADQYPLLNAWTRFMNDAFYNNPTEAIPKRGFGVAGQHFFNDTLYSAGGVHDANGKDGKLDFDSFWSTREWFSWVEVGYRSGKEVSARHNSHLHFWHQDERVEEDVPESRGVAFTYSYTTEKEGVAFVRAGYSRGGAAQMRRFVGIGKSWKPWGRDVLGVATSWGSPPEKDLRDQVTSEVFYRVQLTQNITFTPSLAVIYRPSYTLEEDWIFLPGLRMRFVL